MNQQNRMKEDWEKRAEGFSNSFIDDRAASEADLRQLGEADVRMILADVAQYLTPESRVLEIGCGIGRLMEPMARRYNEVWGVDISAEMVRRVRERLADLGNVRFLENSGTDLQGVPDDYFDLCYSYFTFRHLTRHEMTEQYLREAYRALKHGGILKIEANGIYAGNPFRSLYDGGNADSWQGVRFTMSEVVALAEKIGFQMIAAYHPHQEQQLLASNEAHEDIEKQRRLWLVARKDDAMDVWERACFRMARALSAAAPAGSVVILPESELQYYLAAAGHADSRFLYVETPDRGRGDAAIAEVEKQRALGGEFLVFSRYAFWWLSTYPGLEAHLARYDVAHRDGDCIIYDFRRIRTT
jgi:cyclopropane fatty-acyl-phospholipid synthase-like methyltransferase